MGLFQKKHETAGQVDMGRLPRHIAIIMDGNGRWAKKRGLPRTAGHKVGAEVFRDIATYCQELGIEYLTIYAFSTENWKRPKDEVDVLMSLLEQYLQEAIDTMERDHIRLRVLGDVAGLSPQLQRMIDETNAISTHYQGFQANICLNYGRPSVRRSWRGVDGGEFQQVPVVGGHSRSGADHPPQRRAAAEQFPAVAVRLQRVLFLRHPVAGLQEAGSGSGDH